MRVSDEWLAERIGAYEVRRALPGPGKVYAIELDLRDSRAEVVHLREILEGLAKRHSLASGRGRTREHDMRYGSEVPIGDGPCTDCGQENPFVWWTDNVFWNAVCRTPESGPEPILCPTCFVKRAFAAGFQPIGMRIIPDWPWVETAGSSAVEHRPYKPEDDGANPSSPTILRAEAVAELGSTT